MSYHHRKHSKGKLWIEIIGAILAMVIGGTALAGISDDDDEDDRDDCGTSCSVEYDNDDRFEGDDD